MTEPDRRTAVGPYFIDLWRGLFRSEVRVWRDVRPALGGLVSRVRCRRRDEDSVYDDVVQSVVDAMES